MTPAPRAPWRPLADYPLDSTGQGPIVELLIREQGAPERVARGAGFLYWEPAWNRDRLLFAVGGRIVHAVAGWRP